MLFGLLVFTSASFWYISPSPFPGDVWRMRGFSLVIAVCPRIGFVSLESIFWRACRSFVRSLRPPQRPVFFFFSYKHTQTQTHTERHTLLLLLLPDFFSNTYTHIWRDNTLSQKERTHDDDEDEDEILTSTSRKRRPVSQCRRSFPSSSSSSSHGGGSAGHPPPPALAK